MNCVEYKECISLVSPQGHVEYNARFVIGSENAEKLEHGNIYTNDDLVRLFGCAIFLRDSTGAVEKNIKKWRAVRGSNG